MTTVTTTVDSTAYIEVHQAGTDVLIQNVSNVLVYWASSTLEPDVNTSVRHTLKPNQVLQIFNGVPSNNIWMRAAGNQDASLRPTSNYSVNISVSS